MYLHYIGIIPETNFQFAFLNTKKSPVWQFFGVMQWIQCTTPYLIYTPKDIWD